MTSAVMIFAAPVAVSGALAIRSELRGQRRGVYLFKPLTMGFVFAMLLVEGARGAPGVGSYLVGAGLVASLVGDVFLMLESDRFVAGLVSFLVAHLFYIAAFAERAASVEGFASRAAFWAPLAAFAAYAVVVFRYLAPKLGALEVPVAAYVAVITVMGWQAAAASALVCDARSLTALAGAVLFMASDSLLAIDRFGRRLPAAQALILGTYFAAQWLIAASAV